MAADGDEGAAGPEPDNPGGHLQSLFPAQAQDADPAFSHGGRDGIDRILQCSGHGPSSRLDLIAGFDFFGALVLFTFARRFLVIAA
jgi:hypothetical protein